jgi:hypothetical protein
MPLQSRYETTSFCPSEGIRSKVSLLEMALGDGVEGLDSPGWLLVVAFGLPSGEPRITQADELLYRRVVPRRSLAKTSVIRR